MQKIDADLVASAQQGERSALERLWRRSRRYAAAIVLAHRPAGADTEDLLQEVALAVVEGLSELRDPAAYLGWLRTISVRTCARARRSQPRERSAPSLAETAMHVDEPERQVEVDQARRAIEIVDTLPEEQREVLILRALAGWSQRQIADDLGVPETTVESRLARARRALRERFDGTPTLQVSTLRTSDRDNPTERRNQ